MKYKKIPNTDLNISVISLGTWAFSNDVWGKVNEKDCIDTVLSAIDCGINLIDTAPIYGYGLSEKIVGKAIKGKRDKVILATKCGLKGKGKDIQIDLSPDFLKQEIEQSLKRLDVDYIDLYQCHWPDKNTPIQDTMVFMLKLKKEGKIKHIGLSNYTKDMLEEALKYADIATLQMQYSLLERAIEKDILPFCRQRGISIITYGSLAGGILSGKYLSEPKFQKSDARSFFYKFYSGDNFKKASKVVDILKEISSKAKIPIAQAALNWIYSKDGIASAIVGAKTKEQACANAASADSGLSGEDISRLNDLKW